MQPETVLTLVKPCFGGECGCSLPPPDLGHGVWTEAALSPKVQIQLFSISQQAKVVSIQKLCIHYLCFRLFSSADHAFNYIDKSEFLFLFIS